MKFFPTPKKKWIVYFFILFTFLLALEIYLRFYWGFCDNVLMMANDKYEYIAQPNQHRFRFRNHIDINSYSQRSAEPDSSSFIILGLGDSVIGGGVMVDQDSLATERLSRSLTISLGRKVQVLNVGAGSWGPDNCYAYVKENGDFTAKIAFLLVSSHDAFDNMDFKPVIDKVNRYESSQYKLALWELFKKYALPRLSGKLGIFESSPGAKGKTFNTGFLNLATYFKSKGVPFFIFLHPDQDELKNREFNYMGKEIIHFCDSMKIPLYLQPFNSLSEADYRGIIHMNNSGQGKMAANLFPILNQFADSLLKIHE